MDEHSASVERSVSDVPVENESPTSSDHLVLKRVSVVEERMHERGHPHSESMRGEILPLIAKKRKLSPSSERQMSIVHFSPDAVKDEKKVKGQDMDRKISELLIRLKNIEEKISCIEKGGVENRAIIEFKYNSYSASNGTIREQGKTGKNEIELSNTVIEIRSTPKVCTASEAEELDRGQSLNRCGAASVSKPNIAINISNGDVTDQKNIAIDLPISDNCDKCVPATTPCNRDEVNWRQVSRVLKKRPCYCYECMCIRKNC